MLDLKSLKKVHFIGINSGFNSFCANYLIEKGVKVTASEINQDSEDARKWIERGVLYEGGHSGSYITDDLDLVVYPTGPIPGNPECEQAEKKNIPTIALAKLTGLIGKEYKVIAVAGTHGKTTTSALVVWTLYKALGTLPNFIIGDHILQIDKSWNFNPQSEYLVIEACEYKKQFLDRAPAPYLTVVTNIELDHTDYYKTQKQYNDAFVEFISNTKEALVISKTGDNIEKVLKELKNPDLKIINVDQFKEKYSEVSAGLKGDYNKQNILRACGVAEFLNLKVDIEDFPGVSARFEFKGNTENGMPVYLDYAHNPTKIRACLRATRENFEEKKIIFVWEPHSFERTYSFKEQFAQSFNDADIILIPYIFAPTREEKRYEELITVEGFVEYLKEKNPGKQIEHTKDLENTAKILSEMKYNEDYITVLAGAGNLHKILTFLNLDAC
jgi:UDP-N-acetylmuramate--alanine ligase